MISREPIRADRVRRISGSFSWLDHRLLSDGFIASMCSDEILVYFFLVLAGDQNGVSFYSEERMCKLLGIEPDKFYYARQRLVEKALIVMQGGRYQVLQLPDKTSVNITNDRRCSQEALSLSEIFKRATT